MSAPNARHQASAGDEARRSDSALASSPATESQHPLVSRLACAPAGVDPPQVIDSQQLFAGSRLVVIQHQGDQYRLMITKNGKLILQK